MRTFCKKTHMSIKYFALCVALISCLAPIGRLSVSNGLTVGLVTGAIVDIICILFLTLLCVKWFNSVGLYVTEKEIYYWGLWRKKILLSEIGRIKVTGAFCSGMGGSSPLKDKNGNLLYTMFLVQDSDIWQWQKLDDISDSSFEVSYKDYIICRCIYDQSVIDYLLTLNPNIRVF